MAVPTFAQMMAQTNPNGIGFGGGSAGLTVQSTPTTAGVSNGYGGSQLPQGTPSFGSGGGNTTSNSNVSGATTAARMAASNAAAAQAAATAKAEAGYHSSLDADMNAINTGVDAQASKYGAGISSAYNGSGGFKSQQNSINDASIQNEMAKMSGTQGVRDMVSNGIQGGGVMLDNAGAGTSSAGDALARAYGIQGRQQESKVGSQYASGQHTIDTNQGNLNNAEDDYTTKQAPYNKQQAISDIVGGATQTLTMLNAMSAGANLPDQINIAQQIAQIKAQATDALTKLDAGLTSNRAANTPTSQDANQSEAAKLLTSGQAPAHEFDYTTQAPATLQNTGPAASSLPIYVAPNKNTNAPAMA